MSMGVGLRVDGQQVISFHSRFLCCIEIQFRETRGNDEDSYVYVYLVVPVFGICNNMSIMMLSLCILSLLPSMWWRVLYARKLNWVHINK